MNNNNNMNNMEIKYVKWIKSKKTLTEMYVKVSQMKKNYEKFLLNNPKQVSNTTASVNKEKICRFVNMVNKNNNVFLKPELIKIEPKLTNNMCFQNSRFIQKEYGLDRVVGYNIFACPCGCRYSMDIHNVNKNQNNKLVDYTKDYGEEKSKWFIPLSNQDKQGDEIALMPIGKYQHFLLKLGKCKCNHINFQKPDKDTKVIKNIEEFSNDIAMLYKCKFIFQNTWDDK